MTDFSNYSLSSQQVALLQIAYEQAVVSSASVGRFSKAYELLFSMISDDGTGSAHVTESDLTGMTTTQLESYYAELCPKVVYERNLI